jgi:hypothetical protein
MTTLDLRGAGRLWAPWAHGMDWVACLSQAKSRQNSRLNWE